MVKVEQEAMLLYASHVATLARTWLLVLHCYLQ